MRVSSFGLALVVVLGLVMTPDTRAADHFDGVETAADPTSDIADLFAFPVRRGGDTKLALIMNVNPRAGTRAFFSDVVDYGFRIRPAELERTADGVATRVGDQEFRVVCRFAVGDEDAGDLGMTVACSLYEGDDEVTSTSVAVDDGSGGPNEAFRVFAGLRADPFFTDAVRVRLPRPRYRSLWSIVSTGNSMRPARAAVGVKAGGPEDTQGNVPNVLSLAVELDVDELLGGSGPQFGVVAETNRRVTR